MHSPPHNNQQSIIPKSTLSQVVVCLKDRYKGKTKTIDDMDAAIAQSIKTTWQSQKTADTNKA